MNDEGSNRGEDWNTTSFYGFVPNSHTKLDDKK